MIFTTPDPGLYAAVPSRRIGGVMQAGAIGVIEILAQPGNPKSNDRDRHGCGQQLCFTVSGQNGLVLHNVLGAAARAGQSVTASLTAKSETLNRVLSNVVAKVLGKTDRIVNIEHPAQSAMMRS